MINLEYANAYSEVLEILKYISKDEYNKIPKEKIAFYERNANQDYNFTYDPKQTLDEQKVSKVAKGIIAILFRDYWAIAEQREKIIARQRYDRIQIEEAKREKYNLNNIFKNKQKQNYEETSLIEIKNEKWYEKLICFLRNIFNKYKN